MYKLFSIITFTLLCSIGAVANDPHKNLYEQAFQEQQQMLAGKLPMNFSRAVFLTENSYYQGMLDYSVFTKDLKNIAAQLKKFIIDSELTQFKTAANWAVFTYMTEGNEVNNNQPYTYDFEDYFGDKDMSKMFVTKLMNTKKGNCHSMPYLYKMLCDEMGAQSQLAIAPNHVYIKHISEAGRWANVELTSASFPKDGRIIKELAIPQKALENKIYLEPLTSQESIALTLFDLANNYESQFGMDSFYLRVLDTALHYYSKCVPLLMNKANYFEHMVELEQNKAVPNTAQIQQYKQSQTEVLARMKELGHLDMPDKLYQKWLDFMEKEKRKYEPKKAST